MQIEKPLRFFIYGKEAKWEMELSQSVSPHHSLS